MEAEETSFDNSSGNTDSMMGQKASMVERQLDTENILFSLKADLLGLKFNPTKKEFVRDKESKAVINITGANKLTSILKMYLEHPVVLGYLEDYEISKFTEEYEGNASAQIAENTKSWDIQKISDLDTFISASGTLVYCNFTRSFQMRTFNGMVQMTQLREVHTQAMHEREVQQEKLGWKARLKGMLS